MIAYGYTEQESGDELLNDARDFIGRYVVLPSPEALTALTLWVAHTHALECFESTPRLALLSPEPGSGKTRCQEILETLVPRPMPTVNCSVAALFRKVASEDGAPTVLLDEADTIFGPRASKEYEDLRGLVNAGHRRGAMVSRAVIRGKTVEVEDYPVFAAVSLSGLDDLPDTIMTRAVVIRMRRRAPYERVQPYRHRLHAPEGNELRERLADWTSGLTEKLTGAWPDMPEGVEDRAADVWEPLLAIADQAGGEWPELGRVAAVAFVADSRGGGETLGIKLLHDIKIIFTGHDKLATESILTALCALDESPWGELRGKPLDSRGLARRLAKYEIKPKSVRIGDKTPKGYEQSDFTDVWIRYLPEAIQPSAKTTDITPKRIEETVSLPTEDSATTATPQRASNDLYAIWDAKLAADNPSCVHCQRALVFPTPCPFHSQQASA